ncbi:hypothetical protein D3M70_15505 [Pseudomonas sp. LS-2]|nr:hypothetical protein D3M70_15505 [Pseudomonas sp. LS-2]
MTPRPLPGQQSGVIADRSHALRGNAALDAQRRRPDAFPRRAWERSFRGWRCISPACRRWRP